MAIRVTEVPLLDSTILLGPPGSGKSEVVREKARREAAAAKRLFIDVREALATGSSLEELSRMVRNEPRRYYLYYELPLNEFVTEYLIAGRREAWEVLSLFSTPGVTGTIVVDGLTRVLSDEAMSVLTSLLGDKRLGSSIALGESVRVVALGYPPEYGGPQELPPSLAARATVIRVEPPTLEEWYWYMLERYSSTMPEHYASLLSRARRAVEKGSEEIGVNILAAPPEYFAGGAPTPRSWTRLVVALTRLYERVRSGEMSVEDYRRHAAEVIRGTLGSKIAPIVEKYLIGGAITTDALIELFRRGRDGLRDLLQEGLVEESELRDDILEAIHGLDTLYAYRVLRSAIQALEALHEYLRGAVDESQVAKSIERFVRDAGGLLKEVRSLLEFILASVTEANIRDVADVVFEVDDRLRETSLKLAKRVETIIREERRSLETGAEAGGERREEALRLLDSLWDGFNRVLLSPYTPLRSLTMG